MYIVTGGSGQLGRKIIDALRLVVPTSQIGVSVRNPDKLADLADLGIRVRQGDYERPESLLQAWEGARRVLLVSSNAAATGGDTLKQHAAAIEAASRLQVERVFYTSQISSSATSLFPPARHHAATEIMLAQSGLAWTALRHGFYAESALSMNARAFAAGSLAAPVDGKVSWTTHDDLAAVDAALLTSETAIDGATPPLTAAQALDLADLAEMAGQITGRPIVRSLISDEDMQQRAQDAGVPQAIIAVMMGYYCGARAGEFAPVDATLENLLGRRPQTMESFLAKRLV